MFFVILGNGHVNTRKLIVSQGPSMDTTSPSFTNSVLKIQAERLRKNYYLYNFYICHTY